MISPNQPVGYRQSWGDVIGYKLWLAVVQQGPNAHGQLQVQYVHSGQCSWVMPDELVTGDEIVAWHVAHKMGIMHHMVSEEEFYAHGNPAPAARAAE